MNAKEKISQYLDYKGIPKNQFYKKTGLSIGFLNSGKSIGVDKAKIIINNYPDINLEWLVLGKEPMILRENDEIVTSSGTPLFSAHVYAGDNFDLDNTEDITGYIDIPGVRCIAYFPVVGFSMEPIIMNGDIIGIDHVHNWDTIDPDRIYLVITDDNRMIKYLKPCNEDSDTIICISPNFKEFQIDKSLIKQIYIVKFYGRIT